MLKLLRKFNKLDLFLFLFAGIALAAAFFFLRGGDGKYVSAVGTSYNKIVYFTVELTYRTKDFIENIEIGDVIKDSTRGDYYGVVSNIETESTKVTTANLKDGEFIRSETPNRYTVYLTVKCNGTESDSEIKAEDQIIRVGKRLTVKGKGYAGIGFVSDMWTEDIA